VEISALEDVGVETRGDYYDASGALKDMVQNHLFQVLTMLAMEEPEKVYRRRAPTRPSCRCCGP
jgi:glucose-6-phosphate 1-dehydrogenase